MIGRLQGILLEKQPPVLLIDVRGVSYEIEAPMSTFYHLPEIGQELIRKSDGRIFFFDGDIEGVEWGVGLTVTNKGLFWILSGKGCTPHIVKSAFDLAVAENLDLKILKAAREWIENGKVWECIERRLARYQGV